MIGVLGMFFGALAYLAIYPAFKPLLKATADFGKLTLPQITGTPLWLWTIGISVLIADRAVAARAQAPEGTGCSTLTFTET